MEDRYGDVKKSSWLFRLYDFYKTKKWMVRQLTPLMTWGFDTAALIRRYRLFLIPELESTSLFLFLFSQTSTTPDPLHDLFLKQKHQSEGSERIMQVPGCDYCTGIGHVTNPVSVVVVAWLGADVSNVLHRNNVRPIYFAFTFFSKRDTNRQSHPTFCIQNSTILHSGRP